MSRLVKLTRQQREVIATLAKGPKSVEDLQHCASALFVLKQWKAVNEVDGKVCLTESGRQAYERGGLLK